MLYDLIDLWEVWFFGVEKKCVYIYLKEKSIGGIYGFNWYCYYII